VFIYLSLLKIRLKKTLNYCYQNEKGSLQFIPVGTFFVSYGRLYHASLSYCPKNFPTVLIVYGF